MSVCYFNNDFNKSYRCEYNLKSDEFEVSIEYDIKQEVDPVNGVRYFSSTTQYKKRDIIIVDHKNRANYLLKNAICRGQSSVYGSPDGGYNTKFVCLTYFKHSNFEKLFDLPSIPKIKKIKIYSYLINDIIGNPSLSRIENKDDYIIKLKRESQKKTIDINQHNIRNLTVGDYWCCKKNNDKNNIEISLDGYIEVDFFKRVNYDDLHEYIYELIVYMQLLKPDKFDITKIIVYINDIQYQICIPIRYIEKIKRTNIEVSVKDDILSYLSKCYEYLPFRKNKGEVRNIPYIIMSTSRNIEDNYLMFYRFIECYYKRKSSKGIASNFISYSINNNFNKDHRLTSKDVRILSQEIICLRNQYVHTGYHLKNNTLRIKFKDNKNEDYTITNVDFNWIYEKTEILYKIALDIIFVDMLKYNTYVFNRHF